ncbi:hypothetical protein [Actinomyces massiliensis]|uniref:Putative toxin-antitoxin system, antitoxin component, Xre family n=1 Tax=Actinomyces massiliensis F0489 TaxID=1125718 RepID=J0N9B2_9ACTO|nr:hypothetical protein [Actinomyces massiliensis]EJF41112.1 putative toxin-antitoxin system, antitoxin component, Xre family [Actinomyces massiliensis F0489]WLD71047.1 hypothetical protein QU670_11350 [Actinomyces massiliensis]
MTTTTTAEGVDRIEPIHPGEVLVEDVIKGSASRRTGAPSPFGAPPRRIDETSMGQAHLGGYRSAARQVCRHNGAVLA